MASTRNTLVIVALLVSSSLMWSADRNGTFDEDCCGTTFHLRVLNAAKKTGTPDKEVRLTLYQGCPGHIPLGSYVSEGWLKAEAKLCNVDSSQCEPATSAKIQIESVSHKGKRASGSYSIDFSNTQHEEGKFTARYAHKGPKYICE